MCHQVLMAEVRKGGIDDQEEETKEQKGLPFEAQKLFYLVYVFCHFCLLKWYAGLGPLQAGLLKPERN